jgi:hypothetical protein
MKINWGTAIVIAFVLFMSFILYFIIKVQTNSAYDNELVVEEYYKHDAKFTEEFAKMQNTEDLSQKPQIISNTLGVTIIFPSSFNAKDIKGKVAFYRPSAKILDFEFPIVLKSTTMVIPKEKFVGGNWSVTLYYTYQGKQYIQKEKIYFN